MATKPKSTREQALTIARYIGCSGAHQDDKGNWLPCADSETMTRISEEAYGKKSEGKKRRRKRRLWEAENGYEPLGERGITSIDTLPSGGLVAGKSVIIGRALPRRGDPDVYDDPNTARLRATALGCIGIARRVTPDNERVWTPCTNVSDYRRRTGQSVLGQRDEIRKFAERLHEVGGRGYTERRLRRRGKQIPFNEMLLKEAKRSFRKARKDRLAATPSLPKERIRGSQRNPSGSASSTSSASDIVIDQSTETALTNKVREHNDAMRKANKPSWSLTTVAKLKAVYRRGAGAFSVSHRPGMTRGQWAMGRVNAFLKILSSGKPASSRYVGDNDLLARDHPWRKGATSLSDAVTTKSGLRTIGEMGRQRFANVVGRNGEPVDGDGDGFRTNPATGEDNVPAVPKTILDLFARLKDPDGGFTFSLAGKTDVKSGWAIARNKNGIKIPANRVFDKDGNVTEEGIDYLEAFLEMHKEKFLAKKKNGKQVALGAWHNPEDGIIYFDVSDVYDKKIMNLEQAKAEALRQNQISLADLDVITRAKEDGNWDGAFYPGGGTGNETVPNGIFNPYLQHVRAQNKPDEVNAYVPNADLVEQNVEREDLNQWIRALDNPKYAERRKKISELLKEGYTDIEVGKKLKETQQGFIAAIRMVEKIPHPHQETNKLPLYAARRINALKRDEILAYVQSEIDKGNKLESFVSIAQRFDMQVDVVASLLKSKFPDAFPKRVLKPKPKIAKRRELAKFIAGARVTDEMYLGVQNNMIALYKRGWNLEEIAAKLNIPVSDIRNIRNHANIRGRWPQRRPIGALSVPEREQIAKNLLEDGMTIEEFRKTRKSSAISLDRLRELEREVRKAKAKD